MDALLVITHAPDREVALKIARELVDNNLAACVNVLDACDSVYRWHDQIEQAREVPLMIKTRAARYPEVEAAIRRLHPYELPEIVAVGIERGLPEYLNWINTETQARAAPSARD
jgi:periplasmic divalent cation tolerance protein